jgi:hypothetical protein
MNEPHTSNHRTGDAPDLLLAGQAILEKTRQFTMTVDERVRQVLGSPPASSPAPSDDHNP